MNIASIDRRAESGNFSQFLHDIRGCSTLVFDLQGPAEPEDARDMATRHRKMIEALANYIERDLRSMQRAADVDLSRYPKADLTPAAVSAAVMEIWTDFVRPGLRDLEDYLLDVSEHDRDPMAEHSTYHAIAGRVA